MGCPRGEVQRLKGQLAVVVWVAAAVAAAFARCLEPTAGVAVELLSPRIVGAQVVERSDEVAGKNGGLVDVASDGAPCLVGLGVFASCCALCRASARRRLISWMARTRPLPNRVPSRNIYIPFPFNLGLNSFFPPISQQSFFVAATHRCTRRNGWEDASSRAKHGSCGWMADGRVVTVSEEMSLIVKKCRHVDRCRHRFPYLPLLSSLY